MGPEKKSQTKKGQAFIVVMLAQSLLTWALRVQPCSLLLLYAYLRRDLHKRHDNLSSSSKLCGHDLMPYGAYLWPSVVRPKGSQKDASYNEVRVSRGTQNIPAALTLG
jgi:hypothetical protein